MERQELLQLIERAKAENSIESDLNRKNLTEIPDAIASPSMTSGTIRTKQLGGSVSDIFGDHDWTKG